MVAISLTTLPPVPFSNQTVQCRVKIGVWAVVVVFFNHAGLGTGLKLENAEKFAPKGSDILEKFLHRLEATLIEKLLKSNPPTPSQKAIGFCELFKDLHARRKTKWWYPPIKQTTTR
eukprot:8307348-Ditylum_brightwellii.AAC.1